jgi:pyruvate formate lyase activating enzyme
MASSSYLNNCMRRDIMTKAILFDIERASFADGPGLRTTVFFKGCNLRCKWCHNPESWENKPQMLFYKNKCLHCGKCVEACPNNMESCSLCGKCAFYCPAYARIICGKEYTIDDVFAEVIKDKAFYKNSGGGVTFSGGECMLQIDFLEQILKRCKENKIHTAVDTAGNVPFTYFNKILPYTDLFLYDVKCFSDDLHKQGTGFSNQCILDNLMKLINICPERVDIRIPVITDFNTSEDEFKKIADFFKGNKRPHNIELIPYHKFGENKRSALNLPEYTSICPSKEKMTTFYNIINSTLKCF